jgi:hypothetical protein
MVTASEERVERHTAGPLEGRILKDIQRSIACYAVGSAADIDERLRELDKEWDIERALEANAASFAIAGAVLSLFRRRWALLPLAVSGFLLQHAMQGWCPPLVLLRRLGFRTRREIDFERYALKALRGDFRAIPPAEEHHQTPARELLESMMK